MEQYTVQDGTCGKDWKAAHPTSCGISIPVCREFGHSDVAGGHQLCGGRRELQDQAAHWCRRLCDLAKTGVFVFWSLMMVSNFQSCYFKVCSWIPLGGYSVHASCKEKTTTCGRLWQGHEVEQCWGTPKHDEVSAVTLRVFHILVGRTIPFRSVPDFSNYHLVYVSYTLVHNS